MLSSSSTILPLEQLIWPAEQSGFEQHLMLKAVARPPNDTTPNLFHSVILA
jgi:hypothetical protein